MSFDISAFNKAKMEHATATVPGIEPWEKIVQTPRTWHFQFYTVPDLAEMLITGKELEYL